MIEPWMYETRENFDEFRKLFQLDRFVGTDKEENQKRLEEMQKNEYLDRYANPNLVPPSRLERYILWMGLAEPAI